MITRAMLTLELTQLIQRIAAEDAEIVTARAVRAAGWTARLCLLTKPTRALTELDSVRFCPLPRCASASLLLAGSTSVLQRSQHCRDLDTA